MDQEKKGKKSYDHKNFHSVLGHTSPPENAIANKIDFLSNNQKRHLFYLFIYLQSRFYKVTINQFHDYHKLEDHSRSAMLLKRFEMATLFNKDIMLFFYLLFFCCFSTIRNQQHNSTLIEKTVICYLAHFSPFNYKVQMVLKVVGSSYRFNFRNPFMV